MPMRIWLVPALMAMVAFSPAPASANDGNGIREPVGQAIDEALGGHVTPGVQNEVMVLGTWHLADFGEWLEPRHLADTLALLERFAPTRIAVEALPPDEIALLVARAAHDPVAEKVVDMFAGPALEHGRTMQQVLGMDRVAAGRHAEGLLEKARQDMGGEARVELIGHLLAAYEYESAVLQWSYLPPAERAQADALPDAVGEALEQRIRSRDEIVMMALPLARSLGLQRLYPVDSQYEAVRTMSFPEEVGEAVFGQASAQWRDTDAWQRYQDMRIRVGEDGDVLGLIRHVNSYRAQVDDIGQWLPWLTMAHASGLDRFRYSMWELRNQRMAGHVMDAAASAEPERVLFIVSLAHKPYVDRELVSQLSVRLLQLDDLEPSPVDMAPHYEIEATIDPPSGRIDATVDMRWLAREPTDTLSFLLHADLQVTAVESSRIASHEVAPWDAGPPGITSIQEVTVRLDRPVAAGEIVNLWWEYSGELQDERLTMGQAAMTEHWIELPLESLWVPTGTSFRAPFTFEAAVALPADYELISTGAVHRENAEWHIRSGDPGPDVPLIASDRMQCEEPGQQGDIVIRVCHLGAAAGTVSFVSEHVSGIVGRHLERMRYPLDNASLHIAISPLERKAGFAYARPGLIALEQHRQPDQELFQVLAHEAAHLWWNDAEAPQSRHNFMNESFAEYLAWREVRHVYGEEAFEAILERARDQAADAPGFSEWTLETNRMLAYVKGPLLLHELRERIGGDDFGVFLRRLQQERTGTIEAMLEVLAGASDTATASWFEARL